MQIEPAPSPARHANALILVLVLMLGDLEAMGQVRAMDTETPAYLDFELSDVSVYEAETVAVINLYRNGDFRQYTRIDFQTEEIGSASEGVDYKASGGTIVFAPGEGIKQIRIPLILDNETEADESFQVVLKNPSANTLALRSSIVVTVKNQPGRISPAALQIATAPDGHVTLSWQGDPLYTIERTSSTAAAWEPVECVKTITGDRCEVVQKVTGSIYLFRLRAE